MTQPRVAGLIGGLLAALAFFVLGGGARVEPVNLVLSGLLGMVFGGALYWGASRRPS